MCARAERAAAALPSQLLLGRLRSYAAGVVAWTLDWEAALALAAEADRLSRTAGDDPQASIGIANAMLVRGGVASETGRFADVEKELGGTLELSHRTRYGVGIANAEMYLCRFRRRLGNFAEAGPACDRAVAAARDAGVPLQIAGALWNRGALEGDRGDRTLEIGRASCRERV